MAKGYWKKDAEDPSSSWSYFNRGNRCLGYIFIPTGRSLYRARVFPESVGSEIVADNVTEAEAKAAVEEYWADRTPA